MSNPNGIVFNSNFATNLIAGYIKNRVDGMPIVSKQWENCGFKKNSSDKAYEVDIFDDSLTFASIKNEGTDVSYSSMQERYSTKYAHTTWANGFQISEEAMEDGKDMDIANAYTPQLLTSYFNSQEVVAANIFNTAYTVNGSDGSPLLSTSHVGAGGSTQSNTLATPAVLSQTALEQLLIQIELTKNYNGITMALKGKKLVINPTLKFEAERILGSILENDNSTNAVNALKSMGMLPEGVATNNYITSTTQFFIISDAANGLKYFERKKPTIKEDSAFDAEVMKYKISGRYCFGYTDYRGVFGSGNI
jgi:hypothetical protein